MLGSKRVVTMAKKWRILFPKADVIPSSVADKGHFVVYTAERKRFMVPLAYLDSRIFRELFRMSEDEFGFPTDGPITLACDAMFMECVESLLRRRMSEDVERVLLDTIADGRCCSVPSPLLE